MFEMAKPIMDAEPEISEGKQIVTKVSGGIELSNVSFRYEENSPLVVDDLSLKIKPGQYVAIVGKTGCGKSTLLRLLLGFEKPQKGAIYYDGRDINTLDLKSLRKRIGVVTQNGKLFQGDIYSNIVISAPYLSVDDAWKAAEIADIADDIRRMPMGMHTIISEGSGGISGVSCMISAGSSGSGGAGARKAQPPAASSAAARSRGRMCRLMAGLLSSGRG